ncbi:MAG: ADP compounds hydrolase NudE [Gammaproteobacteria bacterium]|nr:ADP compounds hydrolase NudE [Gammaproteobacteria bacterium]
MDKKNKPEILNAKIIAKTSIFKVEQLDLEFSNGVTARYERLVGSRRGAVLIVPMLDEHTVLLIREYAAGLHSYELGLPKGKIEGEESIVHAANREIQEEVGYAANKLEHITSITLAPGYLSHTTHIVLATDLYESREEGDEPEEIEVVPWSLNNLDELLSRDDFSEARSIAALYMVRDRL